MPARRSARRDHHAAAAGIPGARQLPTRRVARHRLHAAEVEVALLPAPHRPPVCLQGAEMAWAGTPGSASSRSSSRCRRGASTAAWAPSPRSRMPTIVCTMADRMRFEPAEPSATSGPASPTHHCRGHHARHARARLLEVEAVRVQVLLAEHVVQVHTRARHEHAGARAVGAGHGRAAALGVHDGQMGGRPEARADLGRHAVEHVHRQEALGEVVAGQARRGSPRPVRGWSRRSPRPAPGCPRGGPGAPAAPARRRSGSRRRTAAGW